ncbi:MAG: cysteine hydrolase [Clostridiales bacterium]|nr:cysteine hydrolase [Clostridiales bacterium]
MRTLIVVDMQKDFIDGALGSAEAVQIVSNVAKKIKAYIKKGDRVIFTRDTHKKNYLSTREGKYLPVTHCVKGSDGWQIPEKLCKAAGEELLIVDKPSFGYVGWKNILKNDNDPIELIGLCTDICVVSNALMIKNLFPERDIIVDSACCAGVTPDSHDAAVRTMKSCQIDIKNEGKEPWRKA